MTRQYWLPRKQRWTDSPLLWFMIHLDSQAGCDDSTQLNSYFLGAQKILDSQFQIILTLMSTIQVWFFQSYYKLERAQLNSIHSWDSQQNATNTPLFTLASSPPNLLSKSVAKHSAIWCCWNIKELHWFSMRWIKINLLPVPLSSLYHWGDNLKDFLCQVNSNPSLSFFLRCFCDEERERIYS